MIGKQCIVAWCSMPLLVLGLALFSACTHEHGDEEGHQAEQETGGHAHEGSHGGTLSAVGEHVAHVEFVHDEEAGKAILYFTGPDGQTPMLIEDAPKLNLFTNDGNKQVATTALNPAEGGATQFEGQDEALKEHMIEGRIAITIDGKAYSVDIEVVHDHEHEEDTKS